MLLGISANLGLSFNNNKNYEFDNMQFYISMIEIINYLKTQDKNIHSEIEILFNKYYQFRNSSKNFKVKNDNKIIQEILTKQKIGNYETNIVLSEIGNSVNIYFKEHKHQVNLSIYGEDAFLRIETLSEKDEIGELIIFEEEVTSEIEDIILKSLNKKNNIKRNIKYPIIFSLIILSAFII